MAANKKKKETFRHAVTGSHRLGKKIRAFELKYGRNLEIEPCAMSLDFPLSVRSRIFFFFSVSEGGKGLCFCCVFFPRSREGNSGLHSTWFNYSSFYSSL